MHSLEICFENLSEDNNAYRVKNMESFFTLKNPQPNSCKLSDFSGKVIMIPCCDPSFKQNYLSNLSINPSENIAVLKVIKAGNINFLSLFRNERCRFTI